MGDRGVDEERLGALAHQGDAAEPLGELEPADGGQPVRSFVERHRPHLLRAYGIDCLVNAVETTRRDLATATSR